jgi:hypothetical protein
MADSSHLEKEISITIMTRSSPRMAEKLFPAITKRRFGHQLMKSLKLPGYVGIGRITCQGKSHEKWDAPPDFPQYLIGMTIVPGGPRAWPRDRRTAFFTTSGA